LQSVAEELGCTRGFGRRKPVGQKESQSWLSDHLSRQL